MVLERKVSDGVGDEKGLNVSTESIASGHQAAYMSIDAANNKLIPLKLMKK